MAVLNIRRVSEELQTRAKVQAAKERIPLRELIINALTEYLDMEQPPEAQKVRWAQLVDRLERLGNCNAKNLEFPASLTEQEKGRLRSALRVIQFQLSDLSGLDKGPKKAEKKGGDR